MASDAGRASGPGAILHLRAKAPGPHGMDSKIEISMRRWIVTAAILLILIVVVARVADFLP